jgi:invasion protein IalB
VSRLFRPVAAAALLAAGAWLLAQSSPKQPPAAALPALGTQLTPFPAGAMKAAADEACLNCHSTDITRQQRLTQKQWTAVTDKMIGWGAVVKEDQKDALIAYLVEHFGPENDRFQPVVSAPVPP